MSYIRSQGNGITVHCKLCDVEIRSVLKKKGKTVETLEACYAEATIVFEDGGRHETGVCKDCLDKLTIENASEMYAEDLVQYKKEDPAFDPSAYADRVVIDVLPESRYAA